MVELELMVEQHQGAVVAVGLDRTGCVSRMRIRSLPSMLPLVELVLVVLVAVDSMDWMVALVMGLQPQNWMMAQQQHHLRLQKLLDQLLWH